MAASGTAQRAYSVLCRDENTGGIVFASRPSTARRRAAAQFDLDPDYVSCRRAPYADHLVGTPVSAGFLIGQGWHFECSGCGAHLDNDHLWENNIQPEDVVGTQRSAVYCTAVCEAEDALQRARSKRLETKWIRRFEAIIRKRFPEAEIVRNAGSLKPHAYASAGRDGVLRIKQVIVEFRLPGLKYPATLASGWGNYGGLRNVKERNESERKPGWFCASGDKDAFDAYVRDHPMPRSIRRS